MNIGTLLRKQRKNRKLTLKNVAQRASVSEGFLSQVENDVNSPSVDTLLRICEAIGVDAGELISAASKREEYVVVRRTEWDEIELIHTGFVTRRFFSPEYRNVIDSSILVIEPGTSLPVRKNIRNGQEVLCVLTGEVELELGDKSLSLAEGDSVHFWSNPESQKITGTSSDRSIVLWVGTL